MPHLRIVLANGSLASYPQGGGLWSCFLQYMLGIAALGHEVFWLELLRSTGDETRDRLQIGTFFRRFHHHGFKDRCALLVYDKDLTEPTLSSVTPFGMSKHKIEKIAKNADLLWNFACALRQPLLSLFRRRVLVDGDPGHLQVSALTCDMGIHEHHVFLSVGRKLHDPDCEVPTLGVKWHHSSPVVHLPMWDVTPDPGEHAPFSSVTQWTWEELWLQDRVLSVSKRDAYLRYLELPQRAGRPFELAVNLHPKDRTGDRELLRNHGWKLVHPHRVARSPSSYQRYIKHSRAEFSCPKPIHRELKTGWFSDRTAAYLASGRPVLAEDTGFSEYLPTGEGLVVFRDLAEAVAGAKEIDANYSRHMYAARRLAEEYFAADRVLPRLLDASML